MKTSAIKTLALACALGWLHNAAAQDGYPYDEQDTAATRDIPQTGVPTQPVPVGTATVASASALAIPAAPGAIRLDFNNSPLSQVLTYLAQAGGFIISTAPGVTANGTVTLQSYGRSVTRDEAYEALKLAVADSNVAILRRPGSRILQIVSNSDRTNPLIPTRVIKAISDVDRSEEIITAIIPLEYISVTEVNNNLASMLPTSAVLIANQGANAVIMVDKQSTIARMVEIVKSLDKPLSSGTSTVIFPLKNVDAATMATLISGMFAEETRQGGTGTTIRGAATGFGGGGFGGGVSGEGDGGSGSGGPGDGF